jgi:hypothetical protein
VSWPNGANFRLEAIQVEVGSRPFGEWPFNASSHAE